MAKKIAIVAASPSPSSSSRAAAAASATLRAVLLVAAVAAASLAASLAVVPVGRVAAQEEVGPDIKAAYREEDYLNDGHGHKRGSKPHWYEMEDEVPFYVNKVGPYDNPTESYEYYSLHFCRPDKVQHVHKTLGEDLTGDHKVGSLYDVRFGVPIHFRSLCKLHLTAEEIGQFRDAIAKNYYFEMMYDDLPLRGFIGDALPVLDDTQATDLANLDAEAVAKLPKRFFLFKHLHFHVKYNGNQIVYANVSADRRKTLELPETGSLTVEFSYSASWEKSDLSFKSRMKALAGPANEDDAEMQVHWLSILNSVVLVLLLTGFVALIVIRVLRADYSRYNRPDADDEDDYGWKLVHGEVFRFPPHPALFCAFQGLGAQLCALIAGVLGLSLLGMFDPNSGGAFFTAALVLYALTTAIGGYFSARLYNQMGGTKWAWNIILVNLLFVGPLVSAFACVNSVAWAYDATIAVPFGTIVIILLVLAFVGFPLSVLGGIAGRRTAPPFDAPCRTKPFARDIPTIAWYRTVPAQMIISGFLPFSAIYIELHYIYLAVWGHMHYTLFGILVVVGLLLFLVTSCITVALVYFQLALEDYRWWWSSFLYGGSTGFFIFAYSVVFFHTRSNMSGLLQTTVYFSYCAFISYLFLVVQGFVGWITSLTFVRLIYERVRVD